MTDEPFILMSYTQGFWYPATALACIRGETRNGDEIAAVLRLANELKVPVSPRGGGSAQEGGCQSEGGIVLETLRLDKILDINEDAGTVTVEGGVTFVRLMTDAGGARLEDWHCAFGRHGRDCRRSRLPSRCGLGQCQVCDPGPPGHLG